MEEQMTNNKKDIKRGANKVAFGLILYTIILYGVVLFHYIISSILAYVIFWEDEALQNQALEILDTNLLESGGSSILAVILGCILLFICFYKDITVKTLFRRAGGKKMKAVTFIQFVCIFMLGQLVFTFASVLLECGLNILGYSAMASLESATSVSTTVSMFLYASFIGPIAEEIVYRGFVLRCLEKYGKLAALIVSSVLFGIMHANLPQGIFAFGVGLILGYVALEYSIGWSIALHIFNNFVFSDLLGKAVAGLSENMQTVILYGIEFALAIPAVVILWKKRDTIKRFCKENKPEKKTYRYIFLSIGMIIFMVANLGLAIWSLERI